MSLTLACLMIAAGGPKINAGLEAYVNKDLTKLTASESKRFNDRLQTLVKEKPDPYAWQVPTPRWIKPYRIGQSEWLLLCLAEAMSIPGSGTVKVYGFTHDWRPTYRSAFSTGYRLTPTKVELVETPSFPQPVLSIRVTSLGPFFVEGDRKTPAFHPESGFVLNCAFNDQGAYLIRLTTGSGQLVGNSFSGGFPASGGPTVPLRSPAAWKADLDSADPVRQLNAMMWLSSDHLNSKDWRKKGFARESVESSRSFEDLRADSSVNTRLQELVKSQIPWISQHASFALENLARPLAPIEKPPNWGGN